MFSSEKLSHVVCMIMANLTFYSALKQKPKATLSLFSGQQTLLKVPVRLNKKWKSSSKKWPLIDIILDSKQKM